MENKKKKIIFCLILFPAFYLFSASLANAATLSLSPASGTFTIGSVFEVSVFLDTQNTSVNVISVFLKFPADKLQLVSSLAGSSIVDVWLSSPKFSNQSGTVVLKGGIPGGINVSNGLITKLTFRAKGLGSGIVKFTDESRVLLNDGLGTDDLRRTNDAIYDFILPPPEGPTVVSSSHPEQSKWYSAPNAAFRWLHDEKISGYSYVLNAEMVDIPDDISEGLKDNVVYKNLANGRHYFHIKALRNGVWGGVTHFAVNIDSAPPAEFPVEILPSAKTTSVQPIIQFSTTDALSGIDHYELKVIPLKNQSSGQNNGENEQMLFIEAQSPYIASAMAIGSYDIIMRAYDKAGNYLETIQRLEIVKTIFKFISSSGIEFRSKIIITWPWLLAAAGGMILALSFLAWYLRRRHYQFIHRGPREKVPSHIKEQLSELQKYRQKYGKILMLILMLGAGLLFGNSVFGQQVQLNSPLVNTVAKNISNNEIFYVGGKTEAVDTEVVIYLQNLQTGETSSYRVVSDKRGDWFYRHDVFLTSGNYLLWTQGRIGEIVSPPSPQINMTVRATALQFGASRISYEMLYLGIVIILIIVLLALIAYNLFHGYHIRRKRLQFAKEVKEAEEAVRRGFAILRHDIQAELAVIEKARLNKTLEKEAEEKENQLLKDLEEVEKYIGKEVFDIEKVEYTRD